MFGFGGTLSIGCERHEAVNPVVEPKYKYRTFKPYSFPGPWIVAGFSDGYVRVLDRRLPSSRCVVRQWREHTSWVISAHLLNSSQATTKIITGV